MAKLESLTIRRFRNVAPGTLRFHPRRNVLLGKNGTGKTTLLNLIAMVLRSEFAEIAGERYDFGFRVAVDQTRAVEVELTNSVIELPEEFTNQRPGEPVPLKWFASLRLFEGGNEVASLDTTGKRVGISAAHARILDRWHYSWSLIATTLFKVRWAGAFGTERFDEELGYYRLLFDSPAGRLSLEREQGGEVTSLRGEFLPPSMSTKVFESPPLAAVTAMRWSGAELDFLGKATALMGFTDSEYVLEPLEQRPSNSSSGGTMTVFNNLRARFFWGDGTFVSNDRLSYGQKRLLTLLHAMACNPDFLVADEIVNGLHHEWIEFCLGACGERQAFLTSQNPLLFDYLEFSSPDDLKQQFVLCSLDSGVSRPTMRWGKLPDEKAANFFGAYQRGVQYVSEILRTEGLW